MSRSRWPITWRSIAERLAAQTAWPGSQRICGYLWGRNVWDVAARLSANATEAGVTLAVTGRAGAAFLGVLGIYASPTEIPQVRVHAAHPTVAPRTKRHSAVRLRRTFSSRKIPVTSGYAHELACRGPSAGAVSGTIDLLKSGRSAVRSCP
jgi:hypothetical protein